MSDLLTTYRRVQELKDEPWEVPADFVARLSSQYRTMTGRQISSNELMMTVRGAAWVLRMVDENDIDLDQLMTAIRQLERNTQENLEGVPTPMKETANLLSVGLGSGFFTGLWIGLLLKDD